MRETENEISHSAGGTCFSGARAVNVFQCLVVASALKMYAATGIKANHSYTPTNMLAFVERQTGRKFKRTQLLEAAHWLLDFAKAQRVTVKEIHE